MALEDVDGSVSFAEYPKAIALTADASLDGYDLILSGTYTSARQYDMTIQAERIDASYAAPFIPKDVDVTILGGAAENVKRGYRRQRRPLRIGAGRHCRRRSRRVRPQRRRAYGPCFPGDGRCAAERCIGDDQRPGISGRRHCEDQRRVSCIQYRRRRAGCGAGRFF